ncbi:MAG TPA: HAMP domain-containing protein, partial [Rudaea sp.]
MAAPATVVTETLAPAPRVRRMNLPIALKFFLGSAFLIALAVAAAVVVTYLKGDQIAKRAVEDSLTTSSAVQKEFEQNRLDQLQLKVQLIAADPATAKYVAQAGGPSSALPGLSETAERDTQSITDLLKERQTQYGFDLGVVLDARGNVLGRSDQTEAFRETLAEDPLVKPAIVKAEPFSGYWRVGNKLYQAAITPLTQDQSLVGFVLLAQSVNNELCRQVARLSGAQIAFWLPVDGHLQLAASSLDDAGAKALQELLSQQSKEVQGAIMAGRSVARLPLGFADQNWVATVTPTAAEGEGSLGAVLALTSTDRVVSSYRDILDWVLIGGVASIIVALLLSYLLAKGILRPVRTMALAAEQAAAGNYRTQIGLSGGDELARLSRAFDSLLSDLREKSDIEGYVGNLSRFLPEPASETVRTVTPKAMPAVRIEKARREALVLLGLEFRQLAKVDAGEAAEAVQARFTEILTAAESAARASHGILRGLSGPRFVIAYAAAQGLTAAMHALSELQAWARTRSAPTPAAAIVSGDLVSVAGERQRHVFEAWLGTQMMQLDRLLAEAAPGQTLLTRQTGDDVKAQLGDARIGVGTGGVSG